MTQLPQCFISFNVLGNPNLVNPAYISSCEYSPEDKVLKIYFGSSNEPKIIADGETASTLFTIFVDKCQLSYK